MTAVAAALLSALLLWAASPAVGAGWLAWVALAPVAAVAIGSPPSPARRLAVPLAYGVYLELLLVPAFPFGVAEGQWGDAALPVMVAGSPVLFIALVAVPTVVALLYAIRFGEAWGADLPGGRRSDVAAVAVPALAWAALDLIRVKVDPGGLWGPLFLSQAGSPTADVGALLGPWGITLLIAGVNYGLALALVRRRPGPAIASLATATAVTLLALWVAVPGAGDTRVRVAAVQPGYDTANEELFVLRHFERGSWDRAALDLIDDLGELTRVAARNGAQVVVWPEAAMYVDPRAEPEVQARLRRLASATGAALIVPFFLPDEGFGAAIAVEPSGAVSEEWPKHRPMWFLGESSAAARPEPVRTEPGAVGTLLGVDVQDARVASLLAVRGAQLLASSTHDTERASDQMRALASVAASASGVPVVRADWRYGSAIYGLDGEALADAGTGLGRDVVVATASIGAQPTPYARGGDAFGWIGLALAAAAWLAALRERRVTRRRRTAVAGAGRALDAGSSGSCPPRRRA